MFKTLLLISTVAVSPATSLWSSGGVGTNDIFNIFAENDETTPKEKYDEEDEGVNFRPIVGILAEDLPASLSKLFPNASSYVGASYVKWVEAAGARAAPVFIGKENSYYERVFETLNGLVIPGGGVSLFTSSNNNNYINNNNFHGFSFTDYALAAKAMWNLALRSNSSSFPIWGTCLGFEQLSVLSAIMIDNATLAESVMSNCSSTNQRGSLRMSAEWSDSRIGRDIPESIFDVLSGSEGNKPVYNR